MAFGGGGGLLNALCVIELVSYLVVGAFPSHQCHPSAAAGVLRRKYNILSPKVIIDLIVIHRMRLQEIS